ncbi:hypothetical protein BUALT_Bualt04G0159600 [Buddleja alternifolia]|uniref:PWWP domain-containing protein n=1 Tax=Buddleja alternifolia TaxID=168488 RepID=A0AAV6Y037_9LAMI|nr:hypothetical protein BUALT_Bualt04G0159600 [Buddleja alternifolia]
MATLDDIVAATEILARESESTMGGSGSKGEGNRGRVIDAKKDDGGCGGGGGGGGVDGNVSNVDSLDGVVGRNEKSEGQGSGEKPECEFSVGDFVWGKIKHHPWWPGQVYDPRDASEFAVKYSREDDHLLVAFFGDGSCSWCLPSQLVPFVENFEEMLKNNTSKSFHNAVKKATDAIGRVVESKMTCNCIRLDKRDGLARPVVDNAGVKAGVLMPEVDFNRLSIPKCEPEEMLEKLTHFAKNVSVDNVFELAVLRSRLSAFYRSKGGYQLPGYREPIPIEGLEDNNKNIVTQVASDFSVPIEVPINGPLDDEQAVNTEKSQTSADVKIYHRRKQKSVAELMLETKDAKPKGLKRVKVKEEPDVKKSASPLKRKKSNDKEVKEGGNKGASSTGKKGRKKKGEVFESPEITNEKLLDAGNSGVAKPKKIEVASAENTSGEAKEESEILTSPRERKKSKYLSPPYTNPIWRVGTSSIKIEPETDEITKNDQLDSPLVSKPIVEASKEKSYDGQLEMLETSVKTSSQTVENDNITTISISDVNVPVDELLSEIQFTALHPLHLRKEGSLNMVKSFTSALRSSTYLDGPNHKMYHQWELNREKESLPSQLGNQENDLSEEKAKSSGQKSTKAVKSKRTAAETSCPKNSAEKLERNTSSGGANEKISSSREKPQSSQPTDDFMKDVRITRQKVEIMIVILEKYHSKFSAEDKFRLKDEMKRLMDEVESVSEKVRAMAENSSL